MNHPEDFQKELTDLLNRHSAENGSDTPDFILACYLMDCLAAWNANVQAREKWYGRDKAPAESDVPGPAVPGEGGGMMR